MWAVTWEAMQPMLTTAAEVAVVVVLVVAAAATAAEKVHAAAVVAGHTLGVIMRITAMVWWVAMNSTMIAGSWPIWPAAAGDCGGIDAGDCGVADAAAGGDIVDCYHCSANSVVCDRDEWNCE